MLSNLFQPHTLQPLNHRRRPSRLLLPLTPALANPSSHRRSTSRPLLRAQTRPLPPLLLRHPHQPQQMRILLPNLTIHLPKRRVLIALKHITKRVLLLVRVMLGLLDERSNDNEALNPALLVPQRGTESSVDDGHEFLGHDDVCDEQVGEFAVREGVQGRVLEFLGERAHVQVELCAVEVRAGVRLGHVNAGDFGGVADVARLVVLLRGVGARVNELDYSVDEDGEEVRWEVNEGWGVGVGVLYCFCWRTT